MKRLASTLGALAAFAFLSAAPSARADKGHDHASHDHGSHGHAGHDHAAHGHASDSSHSGGTSITNPEGLSVIRQHLDEMETEVSSGNLGRLHDHDLAIQSAVKTLKLDTTLTPEKKKRLQGSVKNVARLSRKLHEDADEKKTELIVKDLERLKAQVALLEKQFGKTEASGHGKEHGHVEK